MPGESAIPYRLPCGVATWPTRTTYALGCSDHWRDNEQGIPIRRNTTLVPSDVPGDPPLPPAQRDVPYPYADRCHTVGNVDGNCYAAITTGATAAATVSEAGVVTGISLTGEPNLNNVYRQPETHWTYIPAVTIAAPPEGGTQATATATVDTGTGAITGFVIVSGGTGYAPPPAAPPAVSIEVPRADFAHCDKSLRVKAVQAHKFLHGMPGLLDDIYTFGGAGGTPSKLANRADGMSYYVKEEVRPCVADGGLSDYNEEYPLYHAILGGNVSAEGVYLGYASSFAVTRHVDEFGDEEDENYDPGGDYAWTEARSVTVDPFSGLRTQNLNTSGPPTGKIDDPGNGGFRPAGLKGSALYFYGSYWWGNSLGYDEICLTRQGLWQFFQGAPITMAGLLHSSVAVSTGWEQLTGASAPSPANGVAGTSLSCFWKKVWGDARADDTASMSYELTERGVASFTIALAIKDNGGNYSYTLTAAVSSDKVWTFTNTDTTQAGEWNLGTGAFTPSGPQVTTTTIGTGTLSLQRKHGDLTGSGAVSIDSELKDMLGLWDLGDDVQYPWLPCRKPSASWPSYPCVICDEVQQRVQPYPSHLDSLGPPDGPWAWDIRQLWQVDPLSPRPFTDYTPGPGALTRQISTDDAQYYWTYGYQAGTTTPHTYATAIAAGLGVLYLPATGAKLGGPNGNKGPPGFTVDRHFFWDLAVIESNSIIGWGGWSGPMEPSGAPLAATRWLNATEMTHAHGTGSATLQGAYVANNSPIYGTGSRVMQKMVWSFARLPSLNYARPCGDDCDELASDGLTLLWPDAWRICGRIEIASISPLAERTVTLKTPATHLRVDDYVDFVSYAPVTFTEILQVFHVQVETIADDHLSFTYKLSIPRRLLIPDAGQVEEAGLIDGGDVDMDTAPTGTHIKSSFAPHYRWYDDAPKGDFIRCVQTYEGDHGGVQVDACTADCATYNPCVPTIVGWSPNLDPADTLHDHFPVGHRVLAMPSVSFNPCGSHWYGWAKSGQREPFTAVEVPDTARSVESRCLPPTSEPYGDAVLFPGVTIGCAVAQEVNEPPGVAPGVIVRDGEDDSGWV